jgi:hypothetical protein
VTREDAIAAVQNDTTKSPEQKVKEIDAIQRQFSAGQQPHGKKANNE